MLGLGLDLKNSLQVNLLSLNLNSRGIKEILIHVGRTADLIAIMLEEVHIYHKFHYGET